MTRMSTLTVAALGLVLAFATAARADDAVDRTADLYKRFTYLNVTSTEADRIFSDMGIPSTFNPRKKMKNPDPVWIPGWDTLALTDETKTAILQAAINRTWTAQVHKDYSRYRAAWAAIDKQFRPELERAASAGYYAGAAALARLLDDVRAKADAGKVLYTGHPPGTVGFVNDIVLAMVELHRRNRCEFRLAGYLGKLGVDLAAFEAGGRPFAADAVERELFTAFSQAKGNLVTPPLPMMLEYGKAYAAVKWPTVKNAAAARQAVARLVETNAAAVKPTVTLARIPSLFGGDLADPADPKLRWIDPPLGGTDHYSPLVITKLDRKDTATVARLETQYDQPVPYACKDTNQLDTTGSGRTWVQDCKYKHEITKHTLDVTFAELPEGLELQKGDQLALYGDLEAKKESKAGVTYRFTARVLASVKRGGKVVWE